MGRSLPALLSLVAVAALAASPAPEVYHASRTEFVTEAYTARGYEVRVRIAYPFPLEEVLDASHDHQHLSARDPDIEHEEARIERCSREICRINVSVLVGRFFAVGDVSYELDTRVTRDPGRVKILWDKAAGTRFVKHLHGELELTSTPDGNGTEVDYLIQVAAPRLSTEKLTDKAEAYLLRLGEVLQERHDGHQSLWSMMEEAEDEGDPGVPD